MLQPKVLPKIIEQINTDGIKTTILLNVDGSILSSSGNIEEDKTIAAIASSLWTSYYKTGIHISDNNKLNCLIVDCEEGRIIVKKVTENVILCSCAEKRVSFGMLKLKIKIISKFLKKPFEELESE
eukprot:gene4776-8362_t